MKFILIFLLFLIGCSNDQSIKKDIVEEIWSSNIDMGSYLCPNVFDDKFLFAIHNNSLHSIDFQNGNEVLWSHSFSNGVEHAPIFYENIYVADLSGDLFCINAANGSNIWSRSLNTQIVSPLNIKKLDGKDILIVPAYDNKLHAFEPETGKIVWEFQTDNFLNAQPAISKDGKYLAFGNCGGTLFIINDSGRLYKKIEIGSPLAASPVIINENIYIGSHSDGIFCVSLRTGEVLKQYFQEDDISFMSSPILNGNMVFFAGSDNNLYAIDGESMQDSIFFSANSEITNLLFMDDYMFVCDSSGMMYLIDSLKNVLWQKSNGAEVLSSFRYNNYIVIGDGQGIVSKLLIGR